MVSKNQPFLSTFFCVFLMCILISSCDKTPDLQIPLEGEYCSYRDGLNGPVSSSVIIAKDTTEVYDFLISNISGYPNTSDAFLTIGCDKVNSRLIIHEYNVTLGNGSNMKVQGEGNINEDGNINFDINLKLDEESVYSLFLKPSETNNLGDYKNELHQLKIEDKELTFTLSVDDQSYNFKISQQINDGCLISIPRHSTLSLENNESYQFEGELYFTGEKIVGTVQFSQNNWQSVETVELELD